MNDVGFTVVLPSMPLLSANDRENRQARARRIREWREAAGWSVKACQVPPMSHVTVGLVIFAPDRRRRDPSNYMPTQKACVDGMVDAGVVPDDSPGYVTEMVPRIGRAPSPDRTWRVYLQIRGRGAS